MGKKIVLLDSLRVLKLAGKLWLKTSSGQDRTIEQVKIGRVKIILSFQF